MSYHAHTIYKANHRLWCCDLDVWPWKVNHLVALSIPMCVPNMGPIGPGLFELSCSHHYTAGGERFRHDTTISHNPSDACDIMIAKVITLRPRQNGRHFADDIFIWIFFNESGCISISISLKFVPKVQNNNIPALVQIMAWRQPGNKPLSEPMIISLLTHICIARSQWVMNYISLGLNLLHNSHYLKGSDMHP